MTWWNRKPERFESDAVEATLLSAPFHIARFHEGDRGVHPLSLLSDWAVFTPLGQVNPRETRCLWLIRENRERLREAEMRRQGKAS